MLIHRLACCIVILLALLNVLSVMAGSRCMAPVPKHFMTSSCECLTFSRVGGNSRLATERCNSEDKNQLVHVTKIGKTEAVFHNGQNNRFICYDVCKGKFLLVDKEELENDPERRKLRRRLNRLFKEEEHLLDIIAALEEEERINKEIKAVENFLQRDAVRKNIFKKQRKGNYLPKKIKRKRKKALSNDLRRKQRSLRRAQRRIKAVRRKLRSQEHSSSSSSSSSSFCQQEALTIKSTTQGHQHRLRHCNKKPTKENLVCTLHEVMHGTGQYTIYAEIYGGAKAYMRVKHGNVRSYKKPGSNAVVRGEFLVNTVGNDMC